MTTPAAEEDEFSELRDANFPTVSLVGRAANGVPRFLITKSADGDPAGLLDPGYVRDLIAKSEPGSSGRERVAMPSAGVTLSGAPKDIAAFIHAAAVAKSGQPDEIVPKETAVAAVTKDAGPELDDGIDGLDPTIPLAAPDDDDLPGDPTDPGSPAWEAIDAATACKWTSILSRARVAIDLLAEREALEAASADPDDMSNAWDMEDVCSAIDYAISVLAPYAVAEQSEADTGAMEIAKAMAGFDAGPLGVIEALGHVRKAGRVLSATNEAAIRSAAESLNKVLTSLPAAPVAGDSGQPVAKQKGADMADQTKAAEPVEKADETETPAADVARAAGFEVVVYDRAGTPSVASLEKITKAETGHVLVCDSHGSPIALVKPGEVLKADATAEKVPQVAVYNAAGELAGICDPADITPIQGAKPPAGGDDTAKADDDAKPKPDAPADGAADLTPAPPADAGTPADGTPAAPADDEDVAKAEGETPADGTSRTPDARTVLKSIVAELVGEELDARAPAEDVAKASVAVLSGTVEDLLARVAKVENMDATPRVFTNGQVPQGAQLRGQDKGALPPFDAEQARVRKQELYAADGPDQARIAREMQQAAIDRYAQIRAGN